MVPKESVINLQKLFEVTYPNAVWNHGPTAIQAMLSMITSAGGCSSAYPDAAAATFLTDLMWQMQPHHLALLANDRGCSQLWQGPCCSPTSISKCWDEWLPSECVLKWVLSCQVFTRNDQTSFKMSGIKKNKPAIKAKALRTWDFWNHDFREEAYKNAWNYNPNRLPATGLHFTSEVSKVVLIERTLWECY